MWFAVAPFVSELSQSVIARVVCLEKILTPYAVKLHEIALHMLLCHDAGCPVGLHKLHGFLHFGHALHEADVPFSLCNSVASLEPAAFFAHAIVWYRYAMLSQCVVQFATLAAQTDAFAAVYHHSSVPFLLLQKLQSLGVAPHRYIYIMVRARAFAALILAFRNDSQSP